MRQIKYHINLESSEIFLTPPLNVVVQLKETNKCILHLKKLPSFVVYLVLADRPRLLPVECVFWDEALPVVIILPEYG